MQAVYFGNGKVGSVHRVVDYPGETLEGLLSSLGHGQAMYMAFEMYNSLADYNRDNGTSFATVADLADANAADFSQVFDDEVPGAEEAAIAAVRDRAIARH